jgi:hypothetical protein
MARRGRPRDPNAKRRQTTLAGRAPTADHGTTQLQLHRARLVGAAVHGIEDGQVVADRDLALSGSALGMALARGVISRRQFEAGERYQALAWAAYGRPSPAPSISPGRVAMAAPMRKWIRQMRMTAAAPAAAGCWREWTHI